MKDNQDHIKRTHGELKAARPDADTLRALPRYPIAVLLENIRSLYNVGSIFRTSDGAGVGKLIISGYTGYPPRPEIDKSALGSVESVPWERVPNQFEAVRGLRSAGWNIIALEHTRSSVSYRDAVYDFPACIVLGNEVKGITDELLELCDMAVEIPMFGVKQSLNVSVAFGVLAYHLSGLYEAGVNK